MNRGPAVSEFWNSTVNLANMIFLLMDVHKIHNNLCFGLLCSQGSDCVTYQMLKKVIKSEINNVKWGQFSLMGDHKRQHLFCR